MKKIYYLILIIFVFSDLLKAQDNSVESKYACVPVAASTVLHYYNISHKYQDIYNEMDVNEETGFASFGDLVRVCEKRGLHCKGYKNLNFNQITRYLKDGCAIVVYI